MVIDIAKAGEGALALLNGVSAIIHNAPFDLAFLQHAGVTLGKVHDSMQAAILTLGKNKCSLAAAVKHYCKTDLDKELQASDWSAAALSEDQIRYAARDVIWLWRLCPSLFADLGPQASAYKIQAAAAPAVARLNTAGAAFDLEAHADTLRALAEAEEITRADYRAACLAIGKPDLALTIPETAREIGAVLTALLTADELAEWKQTKKSRALSTERAELQKALHHLPIVHLVELSELDAPRLSFGETLRFLVSPATGRVYPHYQIAGAPTGRSSTSKPNIQGAPRDLRVRRAFKAADGYVFVAADYSCMELRAAAYFFDDPQLAAVFDRRDDPHRLTASYVAGRSPETITDEERNRAKAVNFGTIYGIGPAGLAAQIWKNYRLVVTLSDAEKLISGFAGLYPKMIAHRRDYAGVCQRRGAIIIGPDWRVGKGRIVPLDRLPKDQWTTTCGFSYPIQGTCADISMAALTAVDRRLIAEKIDGRLVAWIHDELIVEARETHVDQVKAILQAEMESAFVGTFPAATLRGLIEVKVALDWAAVKAKSPAAEIVEG